MSRSPSLMLALAVAAATGASAFGAKPAETFNPGPIRSISGSGGAPTLESVHNFAPFSVTVNNPSDPNFDYDPTNVFVGNVPAGTYNHWSATVQWSAVSGGPWSSEAFMAMSPTPANNALTGVWYASGSASNAASNGNPVTLNFGGMMNFSYNGGTPMNFWGIQTFEPSSAQWDNVTITFDQVAAPVAPASTAVNTGGSISTPLGAGEVKWYRFSYNGAAPLTIDTFGSTLTDAGFGPNDTELGLYSDLGALILSNDDFGSGRESSITLDPSFMPAGTYWLAAGAFNTNYLADFGASSTSTATGTLVINGINNVPEPTTLGLIGLAGAGLLARRRKA